MPVTPKDIAGLLDSAKAIVVIQGDNPDADSLGSALALESILGDLGKNTFLYCGVDIPRHLSYLEGWDRVSKDLPKSFDSAIIVDTSASSLVEKLISPPNFHLFKNKPTLVIDHHSAECDISFATVVWNKPAVSTTEVIYNLARSLKWPLSHSALENITAGLLSDSMGLTSEALSAKSVFMLAEIVESGVSLAGIEQRRRAAGRKNQELLKYKGELLQRVEFHDEGKIAVITIPWAEIEKYSPLYNPPMLVLDEMRSVEGVALAIAFKLYNNGRLTGKIRANIGYGIANKLAEHFGGGGHSYAAGFKVVDGRSFDEIKSECLGTTTELLDQLVSESVANQ